MRWFLVVCLAVLFTRTPAMADDYQVLENSLKDASVEVNKLKLPEFIYTLDEQTARDYFQKYFATNYMTGALCANIGYPVYYWGNNHTNLQKAISPALLGQLDAFFSKYNNPAAINTVLSQNPLLHDHLFYMLTFLVNIASSDCLDAQYKTNLREQLLSILDKSHLATQLNSKIDKTKLPYVNSIKIQLLMTSLMFCRETGNMAGFSRHVFLDGMRRTLLDNFGVVIIDNGGFDVRQLAAIQAYMTAIPLHLRIPVTITCYDFLIDSERNKRVTVHNFRCRGYFNTFGPKLGSSPGSEFPQDSGKHIESDGFLIILAHEYNHNVDGLRVATSPELLAFKERLLKMAGSDHRNYLRSMIEEGFFEKNPQEFIASMANQYFSNSKEMLRLALLKAKAGNYNQINQFILMSSIYSDTNKTFMYETDKNGRITVASFPVTKQNGLITTLSLGASRYQFEYADGVIKKANTF